MNFNDRAVNTVFDKIVSYAMASGRFEHVNQHEPKSAPGTGIYCSVWIQRIRPLGGRGGSGLAATSGALDLSARIYQNFVSQPFDMIDPLVTAAVSDLMGALSGDFDFGGDIDVRSVDLLGYAGTAMSAEAGYIEIDRRHFRVMTLTIPVILNDMWVQEASDA